MKVFLKPILAYTPTPPGQISRDGAIMNYFRYDGAKCYEDIVYNDGHLPSDYLLILSSNITSAQARTGDYKKAPRPDKLVIFATWTALSLHYRVFQ